MAPGRGRAVLRLRVSRNAPRRDLRRPVPRPGVLGPLPGVVGAMMAVEAVKEIVGAGEGLRGGC
jgi:molybdopterin/thiamine biosynthesis adenylyltransferase